MEKYVSEAKFTYFADLIQSFGFNLGSMCKDVQDTVKELEI